MNLPVISLVALIIAILISCFTRLNAGLLSIAFAFIIGVLLKGLKLQEVVGGFPSSLFLTLVGVTLLFAQAQTNGTLDKVAQSLKDYPDSLVDVYGHTDSTGSDAFNQTLSENRARTVMNYLISQGVPAARLRSQGFGETMPVASNDTPDGRAKNRRVEIKIVPVTQQDVAAARSAG